MKYHGGADLKTITQENLEALEKAHDQPRAPRRERAEELRRPLRRLDQPLQPRHARRARAAQSRIAKLGAKVVLATHWGDGGKGAAELAHIVVDCCEQKSNFQFVYDENDALMGLRSTRSRRDLPGERRSRPDAKVRGQNQEAPGGRLRALPGGVAKTQYSFSTDPQLRAAPSEPRGQRARGAPGAAPSSS